jgi:hypothetical protein
LKWQGLTPRKRQAKKKLGSNLVADSLWHCGSVCDPGSLSESRGFCLPGTLGKRALPGVERAKEAVRERPDGCLSG